MTLRDIALLNLRRRRAKAAFVLAGLVISVATVVGLMTLTRAMTDDVYHKLDQYGANILVVPHTENLSLSYGGLSLGGVAFEVEEIREEELARIHSIRNAGNLAAVGPVVLGVVQVQDHKILLAGIDFAVAHILKPWWQIEGEAPAENGVLLGSDAARRLGVGVGERIEVDGWDFQVSGVIQVTGSQDDQMVFTHLGSAQFVLGKAGRISMAEVAALCMDCPVEEMVVQISEVLPGADVMAIQAVVKGRMEAIGHFQAFSLGVSALVVLVGALVVLVTMTGSVRERTSEIGIFRAIGFRKSHVVRVVLLEAGIVSAFAGVVGYLAGLAGTRLALPFFTDTAAAEMHHHGGHAALGGIPLDPALAVAAVGFSVLLGLLASAYPALLAARMDPNEALRAL
ncbi:MAG: ABC transporter permease [Deferrisomatales bacterium]